MPQTTIDKSFLDVLGSHVGEEFTIVNPETYEETSIGHALKADWYKAKLAAIGQDFIVLVLHYQHGVGRTAPKEPAEQYVPLGRIKRITLMHSERVIHL